MKNKLLDVLAKYKKEKNSDLYKALEKIADSLVNEKENGLNSKFEILYNTSQLAYQSLDKNGVIQDVNQTWLSLLGYQKQEIIGKSFSSFIHPEYLDAFYKRMKKFKKDGDVENTTFELRKENGDYIKAYFETCVLFNDKGDFESTYCSFRDISHEKEILDELKESREEYKKLIYNQGEGIANTNENEVFIFANPIAEKIFGVKKNGLIGKSLNDFLSKENQEKIKIETLKRKKGRKSTYELDITDTKGIEKKILVTVSPNKNKEGRFIGSLGVFRDITQRKKIEEKLADSEQKFRAITQSAQDAIILLDERGKIELWNRTATKIFGYSASIAMGKSIYDLIKKGEKDTEFKNSFKDFIKTGNADAINQLTDLTGIKKDGFKLPVEISFSSLKLHGKCHSIVIVRDISERKESELILKQSEERFRAIFELNSDMIGIASLDTATFFKVNPAFTEILGYPEDEIISKPFLELIHPDDVEKTKEIIENELKLGRKIIHFINRYRTKKGDYRILEWKSYPDVNKKIIYAVGHDITRRKEDERKLKESEERFKILSDLSFEGIIIHKKGMVMDCNQRFFEMSGYKKEDVIGKSLFKIVPDNVHDKVKENINKRIAKPYEIELIRKDKVIIPIEIEASNFILNGEYLRVASIRDIRERKEVQQKLIENEKRFRKYIETSPIGILITNDDGKMKFVNTSMSKMLDFEQKELLKMNIAELHFKEDVSRGLELFSEVKLKGKVSGFETRLKTKYGEAKHVIIESIKISGKEIIGFCIDITERKKYESELHELNATKDKFFSIIAHDLRGPINNLVGFSDLLANKHQTYDKQKLSYIINMMNSSAKQTFSLLENLLLWSKSQRNRLSFNPQKYICKELIAEVFQEMEHLAVAKQIQLKPKRGDRAFIIFVDKDMFKTIFRNLISNAIKFTHEQGEITVGCEKEESNMVKFFVDDTGVGIPMENRNKLFKIDQSVSTPGTKEEHGTGLGLVLCKELVEKHSGRIWVESVTNNEIEGNKKTGTTFYFTVPIAHDSENIH